MIIETFTAKEFLQGRKVRSRCLLGRHNFIARMEGTVIRVVDANGKPVKVNYAGTVDSRTVHARVDGVGFIGGWQYPHRAMPWKYLVKCINRGVLYHESASLPKAYRGTV